MSIPTIAREMSPQEMLNYAWQYFVLHAGQRMSLFNFFLILNGIALAGLAACVQRGGALDLLGALLGLLIALIAFVFWKLDQRVAFLLKHAERALSEAELSMPITSARLFSNERESTAAAQNRGSHWTRMWTYGRAFRAVFAVTGIVGLVGSALNIVRMVGWPERIARCITG